MSTEAKAWQRASWAHGADPQRQDEERYRDDGHQVAFVSRRFGDFPGWEWGVVVYGFSDDKREAMAQADAYLRALGMTVDNPIEREEPTDADA
jgi:hypothetical protein